MRRALRWFFFVVGALSLAVGVTGYVARWTGGPIGPVPAGTLRGAFGSAALPDLASLGSRRELQLQVNPDRPRSMNVWLLVVDGELYVPSGFPRWKVWPEVVLRDPRAVLRVDDTLYDVTAERVDDPALRERLEAALQEKYGTPGGAETWFFRIRPRTGR